MVQRFLDLNSTFYQFLLSKSQIRGKSGHLIRVREVEATNQSVHETECDKASEENSTLEILDTSLILSFLIITIEVVMIKVIVRMSGTTPNKS